MSRKEIICLTILIGILIIINIINYTQWRTNKKSYAIIIEEGIRKISINEADESELEMLPGIGPSLAKMIIEHREKNGDFKNIEEIKKVKGIGEKLFEKIKPYIKI